MRVSESINGLNHSETPDSLSLSINVSVTLLILSVTVSLLSRLTTHGLACQSVTVTVINTIL